MIVVSQFKMEDTGQKGADRLRAFEEQPEDILIKKLDEKGE